MITAIIPLPDIVLTTSWLENPQLAHTNQLAADVSTGFLWIHSITIGGTYKFVKPNVVTGSGFQIISSRLSEITEEGTFTAEKNFFSASGTVLGAIQLPYRLKVGAAICGGYSMGQISATATAGINWDVHKNMQILLTMKNIGLNAGAFSMEPLLCICGKAKIAGVRLTVPVQASYNLLNGLSFLGGILSEYMGIKAGIFFVGFETAYLLTFTTGYQQKRFEIQVNAGLPKHSIFGFSTGISFKYLYL